MKNIIFVFMLLTGMMFAQKTYLVTEVNANTVSINQLANLISALTNQVTVLSNSIANNTAFLYQISDSLNSILARLALIEQGGGVTVPDPQVATNFVATPVSISQINTSWTAPIGQFDSVRIYRSMGIMGDVAYNWIASVDSGINFYNNTGLTDNTGYRYAVRTIKRVAGLVYLSGYSNSDTATTYVNTPPSTTAKVTYYVSNAGNDLNDGLTTLTPFKTISKINSMLLLPGTDILFNRGDRWEETLTIDRSGTSVDSIRFGAYGTGRKPIIDGSTAITGWVSNSGKYRAANTYTSRLFFEVTADSVIWGTPKTSIAAVTGDHDYYVTGGYVYVADPTKFTRLSRPTRQIGVEFQSGVSYVVFKDFNVRCNWEYLIDGRNIWRTNIYNNNLYCSGQGPDDLGEGIYWIASKYCRIAYNDIRDVGVHGIYFGTFNESAVDSTVGGIIEYNRIGNNYHTSIDMMNTGGGTNAIHHTSHDNIIRYNYCYTDANKETKETNGIQPQGNVLSGAAQGDSVYKVKIYGNVLYNIPGYAIGGGYYSDQISVYNNTIINCSKGIWIGSTSNYWKVYNNIVKVGTAFNYNMYVDLSSNYSQHLIDYNLYYIDGTYYAWFLRNGGSYSGSNALTNWKNATGWDTHSIMASPSFIGVEGILQNGSRGINEGSNLTNSSPYLWTVDKFGISVPQNTTTDMGAAEK